MTFRCSGPERVTKVFEPASFKLDNTSIWMAFQLAVTRQPQGFSDTPSDTDLDIPKATIKKLPGEPDPYQPLASVYRMSSGELEPLVVISPSEHPNASENLAARSSLSVNILTTASSALSSHSRSASPAPTILGVYRPRGNT